MGAGERVLTPPGSHALVSHPMAASMKEIGCGIGKLAMAFLGVLLEDAQREKIRLGKRAPPPCPSGPLEKLLSLSWAAHLPEKSKITPSQPPTRTGTVYLRTPQLTWLTCHPCSSEDAFSYWPLFSPTVLINGKTPVNQSP